MCYFEAAQKLSPIRALLPAIEHALTMPDDEGGSINDALELFYILCEKFQDLENVFPEIEGNMKVYNVIQLVNHVDELKAEVERLHSENEDLKSENEQLRSATN